jgi:hypothetical protein
MQHVELIMSKSMWEKRPEIKASNPYSVKPKPDIPERATTLKQEDSHVPITERVARLEKTDKYLMEQLGAIIDVVDQLVKRANR